MTQRKAVETQQKRKGGAPKGKRQLHRLDPKLFKKLPEGARYSDGGGLWLDKRRGASWLFVYAKGTAPNRRRHEVGLGSTHALDLKRARERAATMRASLAAGNDPLGQKRAHKRAEVAHRARQMSFGDAALACIAAKKPEWKDGGKSAQQWQNTLREFCQAFWKLPVADVERAHVLRAIEPEWTKRMVTARRVLDRIRTVLDWATVADLRIGENPAKWKGGLDNALAKPGKARKVKHHPALDYHDVFGFVRDLRAREGNAARSLELQIFAACRPGEASRAEWLEFDLDAKLWTIPGGKTKNGKEHRVPLSASVVKMLRAMPTFEKHALLFPSPSGKKPISTDARAHLVTELRPGVSAHGFRSSFRDWAGDETHFARDVIEAAYGHSVRDATEAAYRRADALAKRRELMTAWSKWIETEPKKKGGDNVTPIGKRRART